MGTESAIKHMRKNHRGTTTFEERQFSHGRINGLTERNRRRLRMPTERPTQTPDQLARIVARAEASKAARWPRRHRISEGSMLVLLSERVA